MFTDNYGSLMKSVFDSKAHHFQIRCVTTLELDLSRY